MFLITDCVFVTISVTGQVYDSHAFHETVITGNDATFKCSIPSFLSDFVSVIAWVDSEGEDLGFPNTEYKSGTSHTYLK